MKYRELLELYKKKQLNEEQAEQVKADIEKQEAIGDYLMEEEQRLEQELAGAAAELEEGNLRQSEQTEADAELVKKIQAAMRKAFMKIGMIAAAAAIAVVIFALVILPRLVDLFYYDPGKKIGTDTNQMSLDMAVYTELTMPGCWRDMVDVEERGYGSYDIVIRQGAAVGQGRIVDVAGKVVRNKMTLYDRSRLQYPSMNAIAWYEDELHEAKADDSLRELQKKKGIEIILSEGDKEYTKERIKNLNKNDYYQAYITLDRRMNYEEFQKLIDEKGHYSGVWCGVSMNVADENGNLQGGEEFGTACENLGFQCRPYKSSFLNWDREKYPNLILYSDPEADDADLEKKLHSTEYMTRHFISMLRYMEEQEQFGQMLDRGYCFGEAADYIEKYGILICGYCCFTDRETLLELIDDERVFEITTSAIL